MAGSLLLTSLVRSYEVQVEPSARGLGAGRALMELLREAGRAFELEKVMLTVFRRESNTPRARRVVGLDSCAADGWRA